MLTVLALAGTCVIIWIAMVAWWAIMNISNTANLTPRERKLLVSK